MNYINIFKAFLCFSLIKCQHNLPSYLVSQGLQQGSIYIKAKPIDDIINNPLSDPDLKFDLNLVKSVLSYAKNDLQMEVGDNYSKYTELNRPMVSYVVIAAQKLKFEPYLFNFPIFGAIPYRGYFNKSDASDFAEFLKQKNLDVHVRPVSAYSTTGWLPDPVLSSMRQSHLDLIEVIFHELVHLQFYLASEADFNEAYATWFAEKATLDFIKNSELNQNQKLEWIQKYNQLITLEEKKLLITQEAIKISKEFYANPEYIKLSDKDKIIQRESLFKKIKLLYSQHVELQDIANLDWNNALLLNMSTYYELVPRINNIFEKSGLTLKEFLNFTRLNPNSILSQLQH